MLESDGAAQRCILILDDAKPHRLRNRVVDSPFGRCDVPNPPPDMPQLSRSSAPPRHRFERTADRCPGGGSVMSEAVLNKLERRLGRLHAKLRLGIEMDHEAQIFGQGINFFHIENWYSVHSLIRTTLKSMGLYWRGRKNAEQIQVRHNHISLKTLPSRFDGFTLLHISDLHVDINECAMRRLAELLPGLTYDVCVLTGDYRGATFGPFDTALDEMGIRMLLNECEHILRGDQVIYLAGIDDAHYYRVDNIEKAASEIPDNGFSILLSHAGNLPAGSTRRFRFACER